MPNKIDLYAKAMKMSLENAEQWIKDARLLMENSSFGHADALLRIADEELAKTHICWLTSEKMLPIGNKTVKDVFQHHRVKIELVMGLIISNLTVRNNRPQKVELAKEELELSEKKPTRANTWFEKSIKSINKMRQSAMYVDVNEKTNELMSPLRITEEEARKSLDVTEALLKTVRRCIETYSEEDKEAWREFFKITGFWDNA